MATELRYLRHFDVLVDARQWYCAVEQNQSGMALTWFIVSKECLSEL